jgi:ribose transport system ATP-binding protein
LVLKHVSKTFPGVKALKDVSLTFNKGQVHALLGENGAGKTTLIRIVSGYQQPDHGAEMLIDGVPYISRGTQDAFEKGIQTVHQDLQVVPLASVAENIVLERLPTWRKTGVVNWKEVNSIARHYLEVVGLDVDPTTRIDRLSIAERQLVIMAKAISSNVKILLLDEPTSSLTEKDTQHLFKVVDQLRTSGVLIIFVSHILDEVLQIADMITVLRDGAHVVTDEVKNMDRRKIVKYMIGREENTSGTGTLSVDKSKKVLEVKNLTRRGKAYDVSFDLYKGEVLGFYGLVGAGRTELARILIGHDKLDSGEMFVDGKKAVIRSVREALDTYRMGYVSEDRRKDGLIVSASVKANITVTVWHRLANWIGVVSRKKERDIAYKEVEDLDIRITSLREKVADLSGGNQQKVNVGKWLAAECDILILDEPTVGVDVGAKEYFAGLIGNLARRGKSIILISSDMPEIIKLAGRILVFSGNRIVGEIDNASKDYKETSTKIGNCISEFQVATPV